MDLRAVLAGWAGGRGPLYVQLADALVRAVERGDLADGERLPPERELADQLAVSRTTVVAALARVKELGIVAARQGSGTTVTSGRRGVAAGSFAGELYTAVMAVPAGPDPIHLTSACQPAGARLRALLREVGPLDRYVSGHGYAPQGVPALRAAIAAHLSARGLPTTDAQVLVTTGAQQAITLVAALLPPGAAVVVEETTYPGALDAYRRAGLVPHPVRTDAHGVVVAALRRALIDVEPALVHLSPSLHNPTGAQLPAARRVQVAALADRAGVAVLEDNTLELLAPPGLPTAPLAAHLRRAPAFTVGSLSKAAWGGLRTGWIRTSAARVEQLVRAKAVTDLGGAAIAQHLAVAVVTHLPDIVEETRAVALRSLQALRQAVAQHLPAWRLPVPDGGLSCWVDTGLDTDRLAQRALRHGLVLAPESVFRCDGRPGPHLRLPLVHPPGTVHEAVRRLAVAAADA